jgi:spermidine synthase
MTILLDRREDGSLALYIDGDLQFDSRDEAIYHEALALPGLALAARRHGGPLHVLVCGGGDGLAVRELLKEPRLAQIDLVDYDPTILDLARGELAALNGSSLTEPRVAVHVDDAWEYAAQAVRARRRYHLVVVDLTVPQDAQGARFHTLEWYTQLRQLLGGSGVLAVNGASPTGLPLAYWSIYNAMRAARLHPRPLRIALPSFAAQGYSDDWGFLLASPLPIEPAELDDALPLAGPRQTLHDPAQLRRLFRFPEESAALRAKAHPTTLGSNLLLHYLCNGETLDSSEADWDGLGWQEDPAALPAPDDGSALLPPELRASLSVPLGQRPSETALLQRVLELMPALQRGQTSAMIKVFLAAPERFLAAIDLRGAVERLLARAAELPKRLVAELRLLRRAIAAYAGNHAALLRLGMRIVTILTLVVIVANLFYPDAVYGKGGSPASTGGSGAHTGETIRLSDPSGNYQPPVSPSMATGGGFRSPNLGRGSTIDETGTLFPPRRYRYYPRYYGRGGYGYYRANPRPTGQIQEEIGAYRLTSEADILPDGKVAIQLNDKAYLLLSDEHSTLIETATGNPLLYLARDPLQIWRAAREIDRQKRGLEMTAKAKEAWLQWMAWLQFAPWREDDERELANIRSTAARLDLAAASLGSIPASAPSEPPPPLSGAISLFGGIWMAPDGQTLVLSAPEGTVFLDGKGWYRDQARAQPLDNPYPEGFRTWVLQELEQRMKDQSATTQRVQAAIRSAQVELDTLLKDRSEYSALAATTGPDELVEYGTAEIPLREARRLTDEDIASAELLMAGLKRELAELPVEFELAGKLRAALAPKT